MNFKGLLIGLATFIIIGFFHPLVIKAEYYFGVRCWWAFAIAGIAACVLSLMLDSFVWSTLSGVIGFSCFWSIIEVFEQRERVDQGRFPAGPGHKPRKDK